MKSRYGHRILTAVLLVVVIGAGSLTGIGEAQDDPAQHFLAAGNNAFAFDLYHAVSGEGDNLIFSPYSISLALAMTYAGARGNTEAQMAETLHFMLPQEAVHPAFKDLDASLPRTAEAADKSDESFRLNIANALWGQEGYPFREDFLALLNENYGAGLQLIDFAADAEAARQRINTWVSEQTEGRIEDLIPPDTINAMTRLVLTNAVYFKAAWLDKFEAEFTNDEPFTLLDGSEVEVPLMITEEPFQYASGEGWQAILVPYEGDRMGMVILLPELDTFEAFEESLDAEQFSEIVGSLAWEDPVTLWMPRWEYESEFGLADALIGLGMADAFDPGAADFSGMADTTDTLFISAVIHKAFVKVDESGTEAAAATAVVMEATSAQVDEPIEMRVDHPFIYAIYDQETGTILFLGRVLNPAG